MIFFICVHLFLETPQGIKVNNNRWNLLSKSQQQNPNSEGLELHNATIGKINIVFVMLNTFGVFYGGYPIVHRTSFDSNSIPPGLSCMYSLLWILWGLISIFSLLFYSCSSFQTLKGLNMNNRWNLLTKSQQQNYQPW